MKKILKTMLALIAGTMAMTACQDDAIYENVNDHQNTVLKKMKFTGVQENVGTTRTAIDGVDINWSTGDKISVFDGADNDACGNNAFILTAGAGSTSATFEGTVEDSPATFYAVYPYTASGKTMVTKEDLLSLGVDETFLGYAKSNVDDRGWSPESATDYYFSDVDSDVKAKILIYLRGGVEVVGPQLNGSRIENLSIPTQQTATVGSADPAAMLMVAKNNDNSMLAFKNVCAYVKVTPQFDCSGICIRSNGGEKLSGTVTVDYSGAEPTSAITDGNNEVFLTGSIIAGNTYYIAVHPSALTRGFTLEFLSAAKDRYYARSTSNDLDLARNKVKNLGEFSTTGTWTYNIATTGTNNGHAWQLVTPTLKLATTTNNADVNYADAESFATSWGDGWAIPTKDDFQPLSDNKTGNTVAYDECYLGGVGVLGLLNPIRTSYYIFWTSTPDAHAGYYFVYKATDNLFTDWNRVAFCILKCIE